MEKEKKIPSYDEPVFIECSSIDDADAKVEIGYSNYSSSLFYVGDTKTDGYAALYSVIQWLKDNDLIEHYAYNEEDLDAYDINDFIDIEGCYLPSWLINIKFL